MTFFTETNLRNPFCISGPTGGQLGLIPRWLVSGQLGWSGWLFWIKEDAGEILAVGRHQAAGKPPGTRRKIFGNFLGLLRSLLWSLHLLKVTRKVTICTQYKGWIIRLHFHVIDFSLEFIIFYQINSFFFIIFSFSDIFKTGFHHKENILHFLQITVAACFLEDPNRFSIRRNKISI